ncbi:hypothetical protein HN014_04210 [Aquimarina sp. TRL1]|uniref:hypothetical protein n=1 Tax=Aquimarina sp. (strain TRL1) TaxID=2736252 RepID=UPI00158B7EC4|nr:hypothetical protein [Aquimarina sp. TRL1]QKX04142.1 hypothetical protein HN014_04210 [Aquimarina sp. TRL1]
MKQSFQKKYNDSINLISHLILTKPKAVIGLLAKHGIIFKGTPNKKQLINEVVELLKSNTSTFEDDLGQLLTIHIQYKGKEMLALERSDFSSYDDGDEDEDEFWGALAKGAIGIVGGLFKRRKNKGGSRGGGNAAAARIRAAARSRAAAQAAQAKRDMQRQMERMRREAAERRRREAEERRRREAAERRRREVEERRRREAATRRQAEAKKKQNTMLIAGGGIALLAIVGVFMAKSNSKPTYPYMPAPAQPISGR